MFILHAGLHKTGTTAIQSHLYHHAPANVHYLPWREPNHSDLAVLMFHDRPEEYWVFSREGRSAHDMQRWRGETMGRLEAALAAAVGKTQVLSAEWLAVAPIEAVLRLKEFFAAQAPFRVVLYLRPAEAYMASMAQQYIRTGTGDIRLVWPAYRQAVEKFDIVFGRDAVDLRIYRPEGVPGWDAVTDFCQATGLPRPAGRPPRENVGMGARHLALLLERRIAIGHAPRTPEETRADHRFLTELLKTPSPPFALHPDLVGAEVARHGEDLRWIEDRLGGIPMSRPQPPGADHVLFASTEDVLAYARRCRSETG